MIHVNAKTAFPNYTAVGPTGPGWLWETLRFGALAVWVGVAATLIIAPTFGLPLLWGVIVPLVPAILVIAPGLWRQICPMAFANQAPRRLGFSRERVLPAPLQSLAFSIAVAIFVLVVSLRQLLFNRIGWTTGALLLASLLAAFAGGFFYQRRSGWCGTFCPLGPIQRTYGMAPTLNIAQTYCETCVGCQKNCYDFNPKAASFDDIYDEDPRYAGQRRLFMAMIPGFVLAYFVQGSNFAYSYPVYVAILLAAPLASVGLYHFALSYLGLNPYRTATFFAAFALAAFYWFAGPLFVDTFSRMIVGVTPPDALSLPSRSVGAIVGLALFVSAWRNERKYEILCAEFETKASIVKSSGVDGHEIATPSGRLPAQEGQTLLEALNGGGCDVSANCKAGLCGSDAVLILEGGENLSAPTSDETSTMRRLGLPANARLACSARVHGPVSISQDVRATPAKNGRAAPAVAANADVIPAARIDFALRVANRSATLELDRARRVGVRRVVIVGNGVAGVTAADELRKASESVQIALISVESRHFYNRMALNKIVAGKVAPGELAMQSASWYADSRIETWLDTRVMSIDRIAQAVLLEDGQTLEYDRLILAVGARSRTPAPSFLRHANCFVQRDAEDAAALRDFISTRRARRAVVIGGGVLGVEAAETLNAMGLAVTLIARGDTLMERNIDGETAALLRRHLERLGVGLRFNAAVSSYVGEEQLDGVELQDGEFIGGDVFVACVGSRPNMELARECGLEVAKGVLVNPLMMTTDPNIFAIGDCAEFPGAHDGLWPIAIAQARTAVAAILGEGERYAEPRTIMRLKSDGIELRSFGDMKQEATDRVIASPPFAGEWWRAIVRDNRIVGVAYAGPPGRSSPIWSLVEANADISSYIESLQTGKMDELVTRRMAATAQGI